MSAQHLPLKVCFSWSLLRAEMVLYSVELRAILVKTSNFLCKKCICPINVQPKGEAYNRIALLPLMIYAKYLSLLQQNAQHHLHRLASGAGHMLLQWVYQGYFFELYTVWTCSESKQHS